MIQKVIMGTHVPAKLWLTDVETSCMEQIVDLASLPFAFKHVAVMPDAHTGKGMPIGGVLATKGVVVPNAVGVDIGCGMCAQKTNLKASDLSRETLTAIVAKIRERIPVGFDHQVNAVDESGLPEGEWDKLPVLSHRKIQMRHELGTLGGGNHFIEIQRDAATDDVWVMLHSGSRHVGLETARHYNEKAELWCKRWYSETVSNLAFFPIETDLGKTYMDEMKYCMQFALANRAMIMAQVRESLAEVCPDVEFGQFINIAHNYAAWENHFGQNVIVHRKGATRAYAGEIGIIPGSMGTKSYIVEGLGNPDSFMSCSHGAGRKLGRNVARKTLSREDECRKLDDQGIVYTMSERGLDEAPGAYKNIDTVLANEQDLVRPLIELLPMAVVKGE